MRHITPKIVYSTLLPALAVALMCAQPTPAEAHGGGLDAKGGHTSSKTGEYHYHGGGHKPEKDSTTAPSGAPGAGYDRSDYSSRYDSQPGCKNTRHEVLISHSLIPPVFKGSSNCYVFSGKWHDPYTDAYFYYARELDIDHIVPVAEAHRSGASAWPSATKRVFYDDTSNLIPVSTAVNNSKSDKDPADWMPPNEGYSCTYLQKWLGVKNKWGLSMDPREYRTIDGYRNRCPSLPGLLGSL